MPRGKRDSNEPEIIDALRAAGCEVLQLEDPDHAGVLDLLVFCVTGLKHLEVKTERGKVRPEQAALCERWPELTAIVRTPLEALAAVGLYADPVPYVNRIVAQTVTHISRGWRGH